MTRPKQLVLDANILLRAALGVKVLPLFKAYEESVVFCTPDICFEEARRHFASLAVTRGFDPGPGALVLERLFRAVNVVESALYDEYEVAARLRIEARDPDDWPVLAAALLLGCPIWTENRDFFGCGVATWITANVEVYLRD